MERRASATILVDDDMAEAWFFEAKNRLKDQYFTEQESLRHSDVARSEKDARDIAKEKIYA
eukprot:4197977-Prymnesium_polylepis.1